MKRTISIPLVWRVRDKGAIQVALRNRFGYASQRDSKLPDINITQINIRYCS